MRKIVKSMLSLCLSFVLIFSSSGGTLIANAAPTTRAVTIGDEIPKDATIINEYDKYISYNQNDSLIGPKVSTANAKITFKEYYSAKSGFGCSVTANCGITSGVQMSTLSGTIYLRDWDDYDYGSYPMYAKNYPATYKISGSTETGKKFFTGTGVYVRYELTVEILNGTDLWIDNERYVTIP